MNWERFAHPEEAGIPTESILKFHKIVERSGKCLHGLMIIRYGKIVHEAYWNPIDENFRHRLYSASKSITSIAIGKLVTEGKITVNDKIADYFPDFAAMNPSPLVKKATIRDLLMMATMNFMIDRDENAEQRWVEDFFTREANHMPGAFFDYNTSGSNTLAALVKRITGKDFLAYLRPELDIMGIDPNIDCVKTPEGEDWSGSGVRATLRDFAKFGYLSLKRGNWFGQQLISEEYMKEATSSQIYNGEYGYGYQYWMEREEGFRLWGMGCQYAFCYPEKDLLIVTLGDTQGVSDDFINFAKDELIDSLKNEALPINEKAEANLAEVVKNLSVVHQVGATESVYAEKICGKTYVLGENPMKMKWIKFEFNGDEGRFIYENAQGEKEIPFGLGKNVRSNFPQKGYPYERATEKSDRLYDSLHSAAWVEPHKIVIRGWMIDRFIGNWSAEFSFVEDTVNIMMHRDAEYFLDEYRGFAYGHLEK